MLSSSYLSSKFWLTPQTQENKDHNAKQYWYAIKDDVYDNGFRFENLFAHELWRKCISNQRDFVEEF